jgi:hypothetical protein
MGNIAEFPRRYVLQIILGLLSITLLIAIPIQHSMEANPDPLPKFTDVRFVTLDLNSKPIQGVKIFYVPLSESSTLFN